MKTRSSIKSPTTPSHNLSSHILIAGVSTRAAAESAARAGYRVTSIDAFADLDQHPSVSALATPESYSPDAAARAVDGVECDAAVYLSGFENHRAAVRTLARGRTLWGNTPEVLRRVRDPHLVSEAFHRHGHVAPVVVTDAAQAHQGDWLIKPLAAGGGHLVRPWHPGSDLPRDCYLQELVHGAPYSIAFVAAQGCVVRLGVSGQLIGEPEFGAAGYQYCGSVLEIEGEQTGPLIDAASKLAQTATEEFGLVGVNGIDFIARGSVPYPVEVNPRWCASMELVERAYGISVFEAHAAACAEGVLTAFDRQTRRVRSGAVGKAVVFARHDVTIGDTEHWLARGLARELARGLAGGCSSDIHDVPRPGEQIGAGRPVCTVYAEGADRTSCRDALIRRADDVYGELAVWEDDIPRAP